MGNICKGFLGRIAVAGLLFLAALSVASCVMEEPEEIRILSIDLASFPLESGFLIVYLEDLQGGRLASLYRGWPPSDGRLDAKAPGYDGREAVLVLQEYRNPFGKDTLVDTAILIHEYRTRVAEGNSTVRLPPTELPVPGKPIPANGAIDIPRLIELRWEVGASLAPRPRSILYLGLDTNPSRISNSTLPETFYVFASPLLPDTVYYWRIESVRGTQSVLGPVWNFSTLPLPPPDTLRYGTSYANGYFSPFNGKYPSDTLHVGEYDSIGVWPVVKKLRFRIEPALPQGLSFDSLSGSIRGTPEQVMDSVDYSITAWNAAGSATIPLRLAIWPRSLACGAEAMFVHPRGTWFAADTILMQADPDSLLISLTTSKSGTIDTMWNGPYTGNWTWTCLAPHYDGGEAVVVAQAFRGGTMLIERRYRYNHSEGIYTLLP